MFKSENYKIRAKTLKADEAVSDLIRRGGMKSLQPNFVICSLKRVFQRFHNGSGQLLIEILIGIVVLAAMAIMITQISITGFRATKSAGQQNVMVSLVQEGLEAVEAVSAADWHNIYDLTKSSQEYYLKVSAGAWTLTTTAADETVTIDSTAYQRWVIIDNVNRDSSGNIAASGTDDPSTQKVTIYVSTGSEATGTSVTFVRYYSRSRNTTALQTDWNGGSGQATNPTSGFDANFNDKYDSTGGNIDTAGGQLKLISLASPGVLYSSAFDTSGTSSPNAIMWKGTLPVNAIVGFQFASSNCSNGATNPPTCDSGTWTYYGPNGSSTGSYEPASDTPVALTALDHNNKRYFKYDVFLEASINGGPTVDDIIINWSP